MTEKDIVEKLKDRRLVDGSVSFFEMSEMVLDEAIYEIERLRAKIEAISQVAGKASIEGVTFAQIKGRDSDVLGKFMAELHAVMAADTSHPNQWPELFQRAHRISGLTVDEFEKRAADALNKEFPHE
jgi:hypothetical protein